MENKSLGITVTLLPPKKYANIENANEEIIMSENDEKKFKEAQTCYICENLFDGEQKVRDHCHFTGEFRGAAHEQCNLKLRKIKDIPVFFHNLQGYDGHFIFENL